VERARVVLALGQVDAGLAAERRIHLRHKRGGHLHVPYPALVHGRAEAGDVAHHSATHRHREVIPSGSGPRQLAQHLFRARQRLLGLSRRDLDRAIRVDGVVRGHVVVR